MTPDTDIVNDPPQSGAYGFSEAMLNLINQIAEADDVALRFWATKNLHLETFAGGGGAFAIEDAVAGIGECVSAGEPNDEDHELVLDQAGTIVGTRSFAAEPDEPDDVDRLIYAIIREPEISVRLEGLIELVALSLVMTEAEPFGGPLKQSRFWPEAAATA